MAEDKKSIDTAEYRPSGRDAYLPPVLKEFGAVGALTQSGTGMNPEVSMGFMNMERMP